MKEWIAIGIAMLAIMFAGAPVSRGQDMPPIVPGGFASAWYIDPGEVAVPAEPIKEGDPFFRARVLPWKLFGIVPRVLTIGKAVIQLPDQLIGLHSDRIIGCTNDRIGQAGARALGLDVGKGRLCLVDTDRNGDFDHAFGANARISMILGREVQEALGMRTLSLQGMLPAKLKAIDAIPYSQLAPATFAQKHYLFLYYYKHSDLVKGFRLGYLITTDEEFFLRHNTIVVASWNDSQIPLEVRMFGQYFMITSMTKGRITIVQAAPFRKSLVILGEAVWVTRGNSLH